MIKIIVTGAAGRMGSRIVALAAADKEFKLVGAVDSALKNSDPLEKVIVDGDVLIDFTSPDATIPHLELAARHKKAVVVGTTGHSPEQKKEIEKLSHRLPLVIAPNMSVGVNVMWKILGIAAAALGPGTRAQVTETHHIHKKDKPSGTALEIQRVLEGAGLSSIEMKSIREGEVVGDHTTIFSGPGETLEVTHHASSRDTFAVGALRAAKWIVGKKPGLYTMQDVLGQDVLGLKA